VSADLLRQAAERLRDPYRCNTDHVVDLALADLFDLQADFTDATPDARVGEPLAAVARAVLRERS
jgi:hypothetical protein